MKALSLPSRYTVRALLGEGGSGRVYRVHDAIRDLDIALKLVTPAESAWLRREFDTLRQIRHENLIRVFDWGALDSGEAYYTMELIDGEDWGNRMGAPQPAEDVRRILTGLLRGLAHLHCHGEIHGDLKPGNILLGRGGVVKVSDVGMGGSGGEATGLSGTPGYAAPEVWEGAQADVRSDLYSVGVMAYEALTGHHPFGGHTVREVVSGQLEGWVPSPGAHGVVVPAELERVLMRAVERSPALRQGCADEFMEGMGIEDRIGEILGGKFVGRDADLEAATGLLTSETPGTPTLLLVDGPEGIGKKSFLGELSVRADRVGARVLRLSQDTGTLVTQIARWTRELDGAPPQTTSPTGDPARNIPALADEIFRVGGDSPILIWTDSDLPVAASPGNMLINLARYLWALSVEQNRASRTLIAVVQSVAKTDGEACERLIRLPALSPEFVGTQVRSALGTVDFEPELYAKLHHLTGGNPSVVWSALTELRLAGIIDRRDGRWVFREVEQIRALTLANASNPWHLSWKRLDREGQRALALIASVSGGISAADVSQLPDAERVSGWLSLLEARGWIRTSAARIVLASDAVRSVVTELSPLRVFEEVARLLLNLRPDSLSREEHADLFLRVDGSPNAIKEGIWAAEAAIERSDHRIAVSRLQAVLSRAQSANTHALVVRATLLLAKELHQLGRDGDAVSLLDRLSSPSKVGFDPSAEIEHAHLLGVIHKSLGNFDVAREHLNRAIAGAENNGNRSILLDASSEMAEINWNHGTETERATSIKRIRELLEQMPPHASAVDQRAALIYGLGAALIRSGRREEAQVELARGLRLKCSSYWRMRLANAMASAVVYLGRYRVGLRWLNEAWRNAEIAGADSMKARVLSNKGSVLYALARLKEAADQNLLAVQWARRIGNGYEYAAAHAGVSICLISLADYEGGLSHAVKTRGAAERVRDSRYIGRGLELEALGHFQIGEFDRAQKVLSRAEDVLCDQEYLGERPRLDWLWGRILWRIGDRTGAKDRLMKAEKALLATRDLEDLWGVQVELHLIMAADEDPEIHIQEILRILAESKRVGLSIAGLGCARAVAEILATRKDAGENYREFLLQALGGAERSGMREVAWQSSFALGRLAEVAGDRRQSRARYAQSLRLLRSIADPLTPEHRHSFLRLPHIEHAIFRMAATS